MTKSLQASGSARLRAVREARGLSLREVGRRADVDPAHLWRVERGEARFSVDALTRVAKVLGLTELERPLALYTTAPASKEVNPKAGAHT